MSKPIDLTGKRFNHLVVIERANNSPRGSTMWRCVCDCGNEKLVRRDNLVYGAVKSCGCLTHRPAYNRTHNKSKSKLYRKWVSMKRRCYDITSAGYKNYGGRGIEVCDEWKESFESFYDWAMKTRQDDTLTLERVDVNGNYCPENCTWITKAEQSNNRTSCIMITYNGKTQNLMQWCKELNLDYKRTYNRMFKSHWSFDKAISTPVL